MAAALSEPNDRKVLKFRGARPRGKSVVGYVGSQSTRPD